MNEGVANQIKSIDQISLLGPENRSRNIARDIMTLGDVTIRFSQIKRVPRYSCTSRENDAEHSFMLALVASELAHTYFPRLDTGLVAQYATVHDLIELKTDDVATFTLTDTEIAEKETVENNALDDQINELPSYIGQLLLQYEKQEDMESQYVRLVDKALPVAVDILGPGRKVMVEDYGITTKEQLNANGARLSAKFRKKFPQPLFNEIHDARDILAAQFAYKFTLDTV